MITMKSIEINELSALNDPLTNKLNQHFIIFPFCLLKTSNEKIQFILAA